MSDELQTAGNLLSVALERYIAACSVIANLYDPVDTLKGISRAILDLIPRQLELIATYETKVKYAKATINHIRNATLAIAPINTLPPDILTYVFQLVLNEQPGYFENNSKLKTFALRYPETLTHICWRWRRIAFGSRMFWSRIDIAPFHPHISSKLIARAKVFAARADPAPLYIHLVGRPHDGIPEIDSALNAFCASIATRIRSLNLSCHFSKKRQISALWNFLLNHTFGTPDEIHMAVSCAELSNHPTSTNSSDQFFDASDGHIEDGLLLVRVLRLEGIYFHWTNQVYRSLVELHLLPGAPRASITQSQFMEILSRSPRLRVLHFGLQIVDPFPHVAVSLDNLEVLDLRTLYWRQSEIVFRLLSPGSKPLQLSVNIHSPDHPLFGNQFTSFIARSNIEKLYVGSDSAKLEFPSLFKLFELLSTPDLRTLSLGSFNFCSKSDRTNPSQYLGHEPHTLSFSRLTLHLTYCRIDLEELQRMAEVALIQRLKLAGCRLDSIGHLPVRKHHLERAKIPIIEFVPEPRSLHVFQWDPWA